MLTNTVFSWRECTYRLIFTSNSKAWLYPMNNSKSFCSCVELKALRKAEKEGELKELPDPYEVFKLRAPSPAEVARGEKNYALIKPLLDNPVILFDKRLLNAKIKELCEKMDGSGDIKSKVRKIKRTLSLWWERGQVPTALMPDYTPKTTVRTYNKKPGRPSENSKDAPPLNDEIRKAFDKTCHEHLLVTQPASVAEAYSIFLEDWKKTHGVSREQSPTENQFRNYYTTTYSSAQRASAQSTEIVRNKDQHPLLGTTYDIAQAPGYIYEIDATPDNIQLLSDDRKEVVGRPVLYSVVDVYSGMIAGFRLSFEAAQYKTAADALYVAMTDKVALCARYGISISNTEWPVSGIPASITADNAELTGDQIEHLSRAYGVQINSTSSYRGDEKGTVETCLCQLQHNVRHLLRGKGLVVKENGLLAKAGDKDSRGEAMLTLEDYTKILIRAVLMVNRRTRRNTPPGLPSNIAPTPLKIWSYSVSRGNCGLRRSVDPQLLRLSLMKHYKGTFSRNGFNVMGIRYTCTHEEYIGYFVRHDDAERPQGWKIVLDDKDVSQAWLLPDEKNRPREYWPCKLAPTSAHLNGMTLHKALEYIRVQSEAKKQALNEYLEYAGELRNQQISDIKQAEGLKPKDNRSTRKKLVNIKQNRAEEIERQKIASREEGQNKSFCTANRAAATGNEKRNDQTAEHSDDWDYHLTDDVDFDDLRD